MRGYTLLCRHTHLPPRAISLVSSKLKMRWKNFHYLLCGLSELSSHGLTSSSSFPFHILLCEWPSMRPLPPSESAKTLAFTRARTTSTLAAQALRSDWTLLNLWWILNFCPFSANILIYILFSLGFEPYLLYLQMSGLYCKILTVVHKSINIAVQFLFSHPIFCCCHILRNERDCQGNHNHYVQRCASVLIWCT